MPRTFEEAEANGRRLLPDALRIIARRLQSDDGVETAVLERAAAEIEHLRHELDGVIKMIGDTSVKRDKETGEK